MATDTDQVNLGSEPWQQWRTRITASRRRRDDASWAWQDNVTRRRGAPQETGSPNSRVPVNKDWPLTKAKLGLLYSQQPATRLTTKDPKVAAQIADFAIKLNDQLTRSSVSTALDEELADVVNAAGISGVLIACEKRTEWRDVPIVDPATLPPEIQQGIAAGIVPLETMPVQAITDVRYPIRRLSPTAVLVPAEFAGSNYDDARWLGYDDSLTWEQAVVNLGLTPEQKDRVLGPDRRTGVNNSLNPDTTKFRNLESVTYTEIYYWRHFYHSDETNFLALQRLVFVDGLDEPVVDDPFAGQKRGPNGEVFGVRRNPIQILTLTYISDDCYPPSDSQISRHQVTELEDSRGAMVQQRKHSIPIRWYDTNRISPGVRSLLESGTFQGLVPTNGPGDRAIGEVARSAFPPERFEFDRVINQDIADQWQLGTNQMGGFASGERSAREAGIVERNFQTRIGSDRSKVEKHFVAISEVLAGLMLVHGATEIPPEALASTVFSIRVDSTVQLDSAARLDQLMRFLNMTAQSGFVNPAPIIAEMAELSGLDPSKVMKTPEPKPPEPISMSIGGPEDISNPLFLAALMRTGQAPTPEDLAAAIKLINAAMLAAAPVMAPMNAGQTPAVEPSPRALTPDPSMAPAPQAFPGWESAPRIDRRTEDGGS